MIKRFKTFNENNSDNDIWREIESELEPWDMKIMDKLLDEYEKDYESTDDCSWEELMNIKHALWIGYNFNKNV